ncbi:DUF1045 domain-containing protein [Paracoccus marcusii]|uniref:DUF1045 domain-containing protein n=1 Tax=Paracoccus marcusii TaxID=59779 RepID=A0ABY7UVM2_9RHOB|nr:DUF1045 domain-containing protein [Paracoccus marcusii]WDA12834.1 DUF1045 domain-containing protein [Paracoccus marcusii]
MQDFTRYAVYYAPQPGIFADRAAAWLGWDLAGGHAVDDPSLPVRPVGQPRRYGFHGTIRAPFRPVVPEADLIAAVDALASNRPAVTCGTLALRDLGGFLALMPTGGQPDLIALADAVVRATDPLRAPLTAEEVARRRPDSLTPRQRALLDRWGYPFVMEEFRFHLTLTDRLSAAERPAVQAAAQAWLGPVLPRPFVIADLCLVAQDAQGRFHLRHRAPLSG